MGPVVTKMRIASAVSAPTVFAVTPCAIASAIAVVSLARSARVPWSAMAKIRTMNVLVPAFVAELVMVPANANTQPRLLIVVSAVDAMEWVGAQI